MHQLLEKLLKKSGINSVNELSKEEKEDFERSRLILSKGELTVKEIKEFCQMQCDIIKIKWQDYSLENKKKAELIPYFTVYNSLLTAIDSPKNVREMEEKRLIALLN